MTDTISLGRVADLILSVVFINKTQKSTFAVHNDIIGRLECEHGIIVNGVAINSSDYRIWIWTRNYACHCSQKKRSPAHKNAHKRSKIWRLFLN